LEVTQHQFFEEFVLPNNLPLFVQITLPSAKVIADTLFNFTLYYFYFYYYCALEEEAPPLLITFATSADTSN
jgi:hypothetical protein